jgi:hypothetical protein
MSLRHFNDGDFMKLIVLTALLTTTAAYAYNSGTEKNQPVREPVIKSDVRQPASELTGKETPKVRK